MKHHATMLAGAAIILAAITLPACSQNEGYTVERSTIDGLPSVVATGSVRAKAKVQAIDYANRSIALEGEDGVTQIFTVRSEVKRFNEIKAGDVLKAEYNHRLAVSVLKISEEPSTTVSDFTMRNAKSDEPGIVCWRRGRIVATVESIDYQTRAVKLKPVTGRIITLTASSKLKNLDKVHAGDQVAINYAESVSLTVD